MFAILGALAILAVGAPPMRASTEFQALASLKPGKTGGIDGRLELIEYEHDREDYTVRHFFFITPETSTKSKTFHYLNSFLQWGVQRDHEFDSGWISLRMLRDQRFRLLARAYETHAPVVERIDDWERWIEDLAKANPTWEVTPVKIDEDVATNNGQTLRPVYARFNYSVGGQPSTEALAIMPYEDHVIVAAISGPTSEWQDEIGDDSDALLWLRDIRPVSSGMFARD